MTFSFSLRHHHLGLTAQPRWRRHSTDPAISSPEADGSGGVTTVLDLFYLAVGCGFILLAWLFTRACNRL